MFIRIKKLKGNDYAYLVKNIWTSKGPRQKTKKYLGRCLILERKKNINFSDYFKVNVEDYIYNHNFKKIISMLFELELVNHGFIDNKFENLIAYPKKLIIKNNMGNEVILKINEGFLCSYNLKKIFNFKFKNDEEDAYKFAELFLITGLKIEKEVFVELFRKLTNR
jgi:hypothetical protein